jgi:hypothetical protein
MSHAMTTRQLAALLPPLGANAAEPAPAGGRARGPDERILVDAYYQSVGFSYRLLKALRGLPSPMPRTMPRCPIRHASFRPVRGVVSPPCKASLRTCAT